MKPPQTIYLNEYTPPPFFIDQTDLTIDIREDVTQVTACLKIRKNKAVSDRHTPLVLDKGDFEIVSVVADTMILLPERYTVTKDTLCLTQTPDLFELEITTLLKPHENTRLEGLYASGDILCSQCEAQGFRKITPFLDRPDVMSVYSCTIVADKTRYPVLLSNGNPVRRGDLPNNRHFIRWEDPFKKPGYLFAVVAGDLDHICDTFTTSSGRVVDLKIYAQKENIDQCHHAMTALKQAMKWDEDRFGLEYDLDLYQIVAINDFNAGAMENKGLNIFNSRYVLADPETATDEDFMNIQTVIAHEYFHNWTGNRVTLKNWFQLSLKEGLTVFRDQEFSSDLNSRDVKRVSAVKNLRMYQFPEDTGPMAHPVRPDAYIKMDNFYTMTVYEKGAEIVRMLHQLVGEKKFQQGMQLYFDRFDGMAVTIEDFLAVMQEASGKNLEQFKRWYVQSGTPTVTMTRTHDSASGRLGLTFEQTIAPDKNQRVKKPLHIPIRMGLIDADGQDILPEGQDLLELKTAQQTFFFDTASKDVLPSIFRRFSAPVRIQTDLSDTELAVIMAKDTDGFSRWDAAQTLFVKELKRLVEGVQKQKPVDLSDNLVTAFKTALIDPQADRAFLAKMLLLPPETEIKDHFDLVDVDAIHQARSFLEQTLAKRLQQEFFDVMTACQGAAPKDLSGQAMADRSLKNLCLTYLGSLNQPETTRLVQAHLDAAQNMTDELAAFKILADTDPSSKASAAQQFYQKWHHDKLVLDKWFAVQAGSVLFDTLDQVEKLTRHPDFSIKNPNKVRSLVYMFALHNPVNFHRKDGKGYQFTADRILELDGINHQIAARLATCFSQWKKYDAERTPMMKKALERILAEPTLSQNVYENVSRALE